MANPYATERWLRARLAEHDAALRICGSLLTDMLEGTPYTTNDVMRAKAEVDTALQHAKAKRSPL